MHFFVTFSYTPKQVDGIDFNDLNEQLAELGLKNQINTEERGLVPLPMFTFIGEYKYENQEELKNVIYTEIRALFERFNLSATIFVSVSENSVIGVEQITFGTKA